MGLTLSAFHVPGAVLLCISHLSSSLISYYPHFIDEESRALGVCDCPKVAQVIAKRAEFLHMQSNPRTCSCPDDASPPAHLSVLCHRAPCHLYHCIIYLLRALLPSKVWMHNRGKHQIFQTP